VAQLKSRTMVRNELTCVDQDVEDTIRGTLNLYEVTDPELLSLVESREFPIPSVSFGIAPFQNRE